MGLISRVSSRTYRGLSHSSYRFSSLPIMKKQSGILSFFKPKGQTLARSSSNTTSPKPKPKQSPVKSPKVEKVVEKLKLQNSSSEDENSPPKQEPKVKTKKSKKRAIISSSSESEDEVKSPPVTKKPKQQKTPSPKKSTPSPKPKKKLTKPSPDQSESPKLPKNPENSTFSPIPIANFDPSSEKFKPLRDICWQPHTPIPYSALCKTLHLIGSTTKRLEKQRILANLIETCFLHNDDEELSTIIHLCLNCVAPEYTGIELGIGDQILCKGIAESTGTKP